LSRIEEPLLKMEGPGISGRSKSALEYDGCPANMLENLMVFTRKVTYLGVFFLASYAEFCTQCEVNTFSIMNAIVV
jgi:hypothetical protein